MLGLPLSLLGLVWLSVLRLLPLSLVALPRLLASSLVLGVVARLGTLVGLERPAVLAAVRLPWLAPDRLLLPGTGSPGGLAAPTGWLLPPLPVVPSGLPLLPSLAAAGLLPAVLHLSSLLWPSATGLLPSTTGLRFSLTAAASLRVPWPSVRPPSVLAPLGRTPLPTAPAVGLLPFPGVRTLGLRLTARRRLPLRRLALVGLLAPGALPRPALCRFGARRGGPPLARGPGYLLPGFRRSPLNFADVRFRLAVRRGLYLGTRLVLGLAVLVRFALVLPLGGLLRLRRRFVLVVARPVGRQELPRLRVARLLARLLALFLAELLGPSLVPLALVGVARLVGLGVVVGTHENPPACGLLTGLPSAAPALKAGDGSGGSDRLTAVSRR